MPLGLLLAAVVLAGTYALSARPREDAIPARVLGRRSAISVGAGVSVAYVFVDILPELATKNQALLNVVGAPLFTAERVYLLTLISFVVMYGVDYFVLSRRAERRDKVARGEGDAAYRLQLGGFAAYSALISYLLFEHIERGPVALGVYTLAMSIHFVVVSHSLADEHGTIYHRRGRWVLVASVLAGWAVGRTLSFSEATIARVLALVAGGVVITSLRAELQDGRSGRFWPFCIGAVVFAGILQAG